MNRILKLIFPALVLAATLAPPSSVLQAEPLSARQVQQINSGLFPSSSQDFFEQGRRNLDREIEILLQRRLSSQKELLKIDKQLRVQRCPEKQPMSDRTFFDRDIKLPLQC